MARFVFCIAAAISEINVRTGKMVGSRVPRDRLVGRVIPNAPGGAPETTFTDSTAIPGVTYSYTVSSANGAGEGPQSSAVSATIPLPAPTGVTVTSDRTDGVLVDWRRVKDNAPYHGGWRRFRTNRSECRCG